MDKKPFYTSKTFWANIVMLIASVSTSFGLDLGLNPEAQIAVVGGIMALVNIGLRFMTKSPIT